MIFQQKNLSSYNYSQQTQQNTLNINLSKTNIKYFQ